MSKSFQVVSDNALVGTRYRIVVAATGLYAEGGFENVSLRAIAREAGVSQGLINHHFSSAALLYEAVLDRLREFSREALNGPNGESWLAGIETLDDLLASMRRYAEFRLEHADVLILLDRARMNGDDQITPDERTNWKELGELYARLRANGEISPRFDSVYVSMMLAGMVQYLSVNTRRYQKLTGQDASLNRAYIDQVIDLFRIGLSTP